MPAEFLKAMDYTLGGLQSTFCFLDDINIVSTGSESDGLSYVTECLKEKDEDNLRTNLQKMPFCKNEN